MVSPRCPHVVPGLPALRVPLVILPLSCAVAKQRPGLQPRCASCIMHGAHSSGSTAHPERCVLHTAVLTLQPGPHPASPPPFPLCTRDAFAPGGGACVTDGHLHEGIAFVQGNCICPREDVHVGTSGDTGTSPVAPPAAAVPLLYPALIHHQHSSAWRRAATSSMRSLLLFIGLNSRGSRAEARRPKPPVSLLRPGELSASQLRLAGGSFARDRGCGGRES